MNKIVPVSLSLMKYMNGLSAWNSANGFFTGIPVAASIIIAVAAAASVFSSSTSMNVW